MSVDLYERFSWKLSGRRVGTREHASRSPVSKDRDRIVHSGALRRLQRKSQIVGVQTNDFFRTRLTHTLECAQIGRAIGARAGRTRGLEKIVKDKQHLPDLLEAACLAHDLGHPPFGHNGEQALQQQMSRHADTSFEGNAQSMRIVTRLEPKVFIKNERFGLDLCATTLRAIVKYPSNERDPQGSADHPKFCFYDSPEDDEIIDWLYGDIDNARQALSARMLEAADDIAYAVHDFEDGVWSRMVPLWQLVMDLADSRARVEGRVREEEEGLFAGVDVSKLIDDLLAPIAAMPWARQPFDRSRISGLHSRISVQA